MPSFFWPARWFHPRSGKHNNTTTLNFFNCGVVSPTTRKDETMRKAEQTIKELFYTSASGAILAVALNLSHSGHTYLAAFLAGFAPALIVAAARCGRD